MTAVDDVMVNLLLLTAALYWFDFMAVIAVKNENSVLLQWARETKENEISVEL